MYHRYTMLSQKRNISCPRKNEILKNIKEIKHYKKKPACEIKNVMLTHKNMTNLVSLKIQ